MGIAAVSVSELSLRAGEAMCVQYSAHRKSSASAGTGRGRYRYFSQSSEGSEIQKREVMCPRSHSKPTLVLWGPQASSPENQSSRVLLVRIQAPLVLKMMHAELPTTLSDSDYSALFTAEPTLSMETTHFIRGIEPGL